MLGLTLKVAIVKDARLRFVLACSLAIVCGLLLRAVLADETTIRTPQLDRLAAKSVRFTQALPKGLKSDVTKEQR